MDTTNADTAVGIATMGKFAGKIEDDNVVVPHGIVLIKDRHGTGLRYYMDALGKERLF